MQITIDKKSAGFLGVIAVMGIIILGLLLNNRGDDNFGMNHEDVEHMGHMMGDSNSALNGADTMFLQMMIPHHQQAIDISNLALKTTKDAELLKLAQTIIQAQSSEIVQMKAWLNEAKAPLDPGHEMGHGMGGMLSDSELKALKDSTGKTFDVLWLKGMIAHHDGAIHMTMMIRDANNPEIKTFGEKIIKDQSAQIKQMESMLTRINS